MIDWLGSALGLSMSLSLSLLFMTLIAMAIPLLIHLLSNSKGQLIKIAHTQLLPLAKQQPVTHLQLRQRVLLLLRLSMLGVLALILADGRLAKDSDNPQQSNQIAVSAHWLSQANETQRHGLADALAGSSALLLAPQPRWISAQQIHQWTEVAPANLASNLWAQLQAQTWRFENANKVTIYATDSALEYLGAKPALQAQYHWEILPTPISSSEQQSISVVIQAAADSQYLPYWQHALSLLQNVAAPELMIDWSIAPPNPLSNDADWTIKLPSRLEQVASAPEIARINESVKTAEFPVLLSQMLLEKFPLSMPVHVKLSLAQISETAYEGKKDIDMAQLTAPAEGAPLLPYLSMLLILLFCLERWYSEKFGAANTPKVSEPQV
ncbi:BatA domain-containing protein [Aliiglaciecola litoralis]|uniref:Aerotolerance regulator N-terminal domain-containing protein n=1 Tax=Aliiglaciecola litoralis TaxID=582857 RepID=A0ABP3WYQ7_9ALTE